MCIFITSNDIGAAIHLEILPQDTQSPRVEALGSILATILQPAPDATLRIGDLDNGKPQDLALVP
jgi:hypothetical protein